MTNNTPLYTPSYPHWSPSAFGPKSDAMPTPAELGTTNDPRALIPGNPAAIQAKLFVLGRLSSGIDEAAASFGKIQAGDDSWQGSAGDAARAALNREVPAWRDTATAFDNVKQQLQDYSHTLEAAQNQAAQAIEKFNQGRQASEAATDQYNRAMQQRIGRITQGASPPPLPLMSDPGQADRQEAQAILQDARAKVANAGAAAASAVRAQGDSAPQGPGPLESLGDRAADLGLSALKTGGRLLGGAASAVGGIVKPLLGTAANPIMMLTHPMQAEVNSMNMGAGLVHAAAYPVDTAKGFVAWDDWDKDPAAALGKVGVNVGSIFVGGGAAAKGAEIGADGAKLASRFAGNAEKTVGDAGNIGKAASGVDHAPWGKPANWAEPIPDDGTRFGPHGSEPSPAIEPPPHSGDVGHESAHPGDVGHSEQLPFHATHDTWPSTRGELDHHLPTAGHEPPPALHDPVQPEGQPSLSPSAADRQVRLDSIQKQIDQLNRQFEARSTDFRNVPSSEWHHMFEGEQAIKRQITDLEAKKAQIARIFGGAS